MDGPTTAAPIALAHGRRQGSAPVTLVALGFLALLTMWAGPRLADLEGFVALYLVWISALTMPHLAVVAWMDRRGAPRNDAAGRDARRADVRHRPRRARPAP